MYRIWMMNLFFYINFKASYRYFIYPEGNELSICFSLRSVISELMLFLTVILLHQHLGGSVGCLDWMVATRH